ncbi:MAG: hypothetical protein V4574_20645 [Pseudomonadota bacterium]
MMDQIGPPLERLTHRLAETPGEFLGEPRVGGRGEVAVAALVNDLLHGFGGAADPALLARFDGSGPTDRNRLMLAAVTVWLLSDEWPARVPASRESVIGLLDATVAALAQTAPADRYVGDPERREELARTALAALGCRPEGESAAQASDRLSAVSGTERARLLRASRDAEERARAVREALIRKAAEESADKWSRE